MNQKFCITRTLPDDIRHHLKNKEHSKVSDYFISLEKEMDASEKAVLLQMETASMDFFTYAELADLPSRIAPFFGELLVQNEKGDRVIMVYDRDRSATMLKGARYHQTHEGGSIHTDNVNIPEPWEYLFLSCIESSMLGGESILVDGVQVHQTLQSKYSDALKTLESNFYWEMRGVADELYQAPIVTYNKKGEPLFRHLRPYMESAFHKAGVEISEEQLYAIDVLDALTNSSEYQQRLKLKKGDLLITKDAQVLHGRTCFVDAVNAKSFDQVVADPSLKLKRTMERLWIRK